MDEDDTWREPDSIPETELRRWRSNRAALRELLSDRQWHKNYELAEAGGLSFHGSLYALRQQGWLIETRYILPGLWEYRLTGRGEPRAKPKMSEREARIARLYLSAAEAAFGSEAARQLQEMLPDDVSLITQS
ncbi:MAG: hypothetical protein QOJ13_44 [Gaiellales bacterium]|nr:hypothetical protein [Gaiellales bacterium]